SLPTLQVAQTALKEQGIAVRDLQFGVYDEGSFRITDTMGYVIDPRHPSYTGPTSGPEFEENLRNYEIVSAQNAQVFDSVRAAITEGRSVVPEQRTAVIVPPKSPDR